MATDAEKRAAKKYARSAKGKAAKRAWRDAHRDKVRKWKREWARSDAGIKQARNWRAKSPKSMYLLNKASAKKRNLTFEITRDQFISLIIQDCHYCGSKPPVDSGRNGCDRVDNLVGYLMANLVPCCFTCNQMKGKRGQVEFIEHCMDITTFQLENNHAAI